MSFVPAGSSRDFWAVFAVVAVGALALVSRLKFGSGEAVVSPPSGRAGDAAPGGETPATEDDDLDWTSGEASGVGGIPVTAEGEAFIATAEEVRLLPLVARDTESEDIPGWMRSAIEAGVLPRWSPSVPDARGAMGGAQSAKPGTALNPGDFTAARIRPGVAGAYAWRLETLGRDGDFGFFPFATELGARAALDLLEQHGVVSRPGNESGQPIPPSAEDFEEARRRYEETERALALDAEDGPAPGDDHWTSDRR